MLGQLGLTQPVIQKQLISPGSPVESSLVTLPPGCGQCVGTAHTDALFTDAKDVELLTWTSKDGGLTWTAGPGMAWSGLAVDSGRGVPAGNVVLTITVLCSGWDGAQIKGSLRSASGITSDLTLEVT